jgi:Zn-dependent protease with chaperone function
MTVRRAGPRLTRDWVAGACAALLFAALAVAAPAWADSLSVAPDSVASDVASGASAAAASAAAAGESAAADSAALASSGLEAPPGALAAHDYVAIVRASFTPENRAYAMRRNWLVLIDSLYTIAVGLFLLFSGLSARMRDVAEAMGSKRYVRVLVFLTLYSVIAGVLTFPLSWYSSFALEHQYGLSTQSFGAWLADELKGQAVIVVFLGVLPLLSLAYRVMEKRPKYWWLLLAIGTLPAFTAFTLIEPVVIDPVFNHFTPLRDAELRREIIALAEKAGIPGRNVYEVDQSTRTKKYNAYVNGFGASQRIVLWDTILKGMTRDEILYVMGHEMGHYALKHTWQGIAFTSLASFLFLWLTARILSFALRHWGKRWKIRALHDVASMPALALALTLVSLLVQPLVFAYNRRVEREADLFGLEVTHLNDAAARAFIKLESQNRSDPEPSTWLKILLYTHPPVIERVRLAESYHPWTEGQPNRFYRPRGQDVPSSNP